MSDDEEQSLMDLGNLKIGINLRRMPVEFLENRNKKIFLLKCSFLMACMFISASGMWLREFGPGKGLEQLFN